MTYTVKQLAKISGVSVRTLHWYDAKGVLKPAYYGNNGYRYYEEEQLLLLQQILFFKELDFTLHDIKKLLLLDDFDNIRALQAHRHVLTKDISRKKILIKTIDKTILRVRGKNTMANKDLYDGFDSSKQKEYQQYLVKKHGLGAEKLLDQSQKRTRKWDKDEWNDVKNAGNVIYKELASAIESDFAPESDKVQEIIQRHYELQNRFYDVTKEVYLGLSDLYKQHPDFKKFFDVYHADMIEYIGRAMKYYADKNL